MMCAFPPILNILLTCFSGQKIIMIETLLMLIMIELVLMVLIELVVVMLIMTMLMMMVKSALKYQSDLLQ